MSELKNVSINPVFTEWLAEGIDLLRQYHEYSEEMRKRGRGFTYYGPYSVDTIVNALKSLSVVLEEGTVQAESQAAQGISDDGGTQ